MRIIGNLVLIIGWIILLSTCRHEEFEALAPPPGSSVPVTNSIDSTALELVVNQANAEASLLTTANGSIAGFTKFKGQLIVRGDFTEIGGIGANGIAAFNGTSWAAMGDEFLDKSLVGQEWGVPLYHLADFLEYKSELYVTGTFDKVGGISSRNLARWDGVNWKAVAGGINYDLGYYSPGWMTVGGLSLEVLNDELYIGGGSMDGSKALVKWNDKQLTPVMEYPTLAITHDIITYQNSIYGSVFLGNGINTLARFDGTRWTTLRQQNENWQGMDVYQGKIYGRPGTWNGIQFESFNYPLEDVNIIKTAGNYLYIVGDDYLNISGQSNPPEYRSLMRWDGIEWSSLLQGLEGDWIGPVEDFQGIIYLGLQQYGRVSSSILVLE